MKIKRTDATFTSEWMNEWTTPAPTRWPPLGSTDVRVPTGDKRQTNWGDTTVMALKGLNGIYMLWLQPASLLFVSAATGVLLGDHSWTWWGNEGGGRCHIHGWLSGTWCVFSSPSLPSQRFPFRPPPACIWLGPLKMAPSFPRRRDDDDHDNEDGIQGDMTPRKCKSRQIRCL